MSDFNTLILKQIFWKTKTFFKNFEHRFLVESTNTENATLPCKTALSEANFKANSMCIQNGPITKDGVLPVTTLIFWKSYFSLRTSYKELICCTSDPNTHIQSFDRRWSFTWGCFFPVSILKNKKGRNFHVLLSFQIKTLIKTLILM